MSPSGNGAVAGATPAWLLTTVSAVRELMLRRLEAATLDPDARRDMEMALEELDVMWEELQGQAALLTRENERYSQFFEFAPDAYLVTDAGGGIREANHSAAELLGAPREALAGRVLFDFVAPEDRTCFLARAVGMTLAGAPRSSCWGARVQPGAGAPFAADFTVRVIPLKKSGTGGLCWLVRASA
jgi:PAS domain S-box-containing protein